MTTLEQEQVLVQASETMAHFKSTFGRDLSSAAIAESYVAEAFDLEIDVVHRSGYDAISPEGQRYQIIHRHPQIQNVDITNFDFDYLILINLNNEYQPSGMWRITVEQAHNIFVERPKYGRFHATQKIIKNVGEFFSAERNDTTATQDILKLAASVYEGLSQQETEEIEQIALDRRDFFGSGKK